MCANCLTTADVALAHVGLAAIVLKQPVHGALAAVGLVRPYDPVARDVRTVAFLRSLELDPDEILGAEVVTAADAWVPTAYEPPLRSARPIGSHILLSTQ